MGWWSEINIWKNKYNIYTSVWILDWNDETAKWQNRNKLKLEMRTQKLEVEFKVSSLDFQ